MSNTFELLLLTEISRVRKDMYNDTLNGSTEKRSAELPDALGPIVQLQEKLYVPVKEYPDVSMFVVLLIFSCITQYAIKITFIFISCFKSAMYEIGNGSNFMWLIKHFLFSVYFHLVFGPQLGPCILSVKGESWTSWCFLPTL